MKPKLNTRWTIPLVIILLLAFALRVGWLDRLPLWWDEGLSAYLSHYSPLALLGEMQATEHADPPVYPIALSGWRALAGPTPFALRYFSATMSVLAVALTWTIGQWLADKKAALLGTLFVALAPMQVYYAREAKTYAFTSACALLSTYAWGRKLGYANSPHRRSVGWWAAYVLGTAGAVGSHYYLSLLVLWQGLWVAGGAALAAISGTATRRRMLAGLGWWTLAAGAVALLLLPSALFLYNTTVQGVATASANEPLPPWSYLGQVALAFGAGNHGEGLGAIVAAIGLIVFGIVGGLNGRRRLFLASWVAVPLSVAYFVQTIYSFFSPRFLLYLGPALYLLAAQGIATLQHRRWPWLSNAITVILVLAALCLWAPTLTRIYAASADGAEDPTPAIAHLRALARPGDALAYVYIWQAGYVFSYYPQNELTFYRAHHTPESVAQEMKAIAADHPRLWLLSYQIGTGDPNNLPASWLEAEAYKVESNWYGDHNLALCLAPDFATAGVGPDEGTARFDGRIELRYPIIDARLRPGDAIALPLRWQTLEVIDEDYGVFVHLAEPGVPPLAQSDGQPQNGLAPTGKWAVGQEVLDRRAMLLPADTPAGRYQVLAGLYRPADGSRLPVGGEGDGDSVLLGYVEVEP